MCRQLVDKLSDHSPDHSSLTVIRERLPNSVHEAVFEWVLKLADSKNLIDGRTVAVDFTTLEADAAMKSIVRRISGQDWRVYVIGLMRAEGLASEGQETERVNDFETPAKRIYCRVVAPVCGLAADSRVG